MGKRIINAICLSTMLISIAVGAVILYRIFSPEVLFEAQPIPKKISAQSNYQEDMLVIPAIGVETKIAMDESALDYGGWVQQIDIATKLPEVIAVHRFGWENISTEQKLKQTLYHVDKLKPGDEVIIFWKQMKYSYNVKEIITATNNPEVGKDDVLIYTCKFFNSPQRIFVVLDQ